METSLHQQLKAHYAGAGGQTEVRVDGYRIDAVRRGLLIEIQHAGLAAIRDKVRALCESHRVLVVKPIVVRRRLVKLERLGGEVVSARWSPKRGAPADLFDELVHFTRAFPHPRLVIETPLVEVEEIRCPGHGRRRRWRRGDHVTVDQRLTNVGETLRFAKPADLWRLVPGELPAVFDTAELAAAMGAPRWIAQRAAYALRAMGAARRVGKRRGAWLYERVKRRRTAA